MTSINCHIQLPLSERQEHIDLNSPCCLHGKTHGTVKAWARRALAERLSIDLADWPKGKICICHVCEHNSANGYCLNPRHIYFGTHKENIADMHRDNPHVMELSIASLKRSQPAAVQAALAPTARAKKKATFKQNKHSQGHRNSQYGTMWITNEVESKKIKRSDPVPDGWRPGRKMP
jgi:hypothetical protein